jgi:uncharacterized protein YjiS (DUF1127 family)
MDLFRPLRRAWAQYREFERVRTELDDSSDRQLADMGIARGDIGRIAYEHAEQHALRLFPDAATAAASGRTVQPAARPGLRFAR